LPSGIVSEEAVRLVASPIWGMPFAEFWDRLECIPFAQTGCHAALGEKYFSDQPVRTRY